MLNRTRGALAALTAAAALATVGACSSSGSTDSPGTAGRPTAIVSLSPTATEMLFAIGAGSQVKAVDKDSDYPASAPHSNLDAYQLNTEAVAAYRPDLVVGSGFTAAQEKQLRALHIPVLDEPAATDLDQTYAQLEQLGRVTGHEAGATAEVTSMKRQIAAITKAVPDHATATYYYELDQTYYSETSSTFIGRVLRLLGLTSIADSAKGAAASGGYPQLSAEFVLKANPDYVFLADTRCCKQSAATVAKRPGWSTLAAVRAGRVVTLDDDIASRWGPRIVDLLRVVAEAVARHPAPTKP